MATTATFLTEFRSSMTFEYKTAMDNNQDGVGMTPQQFSLVDHKSPEVTFDMRRSSDLQHSPGSSRGTSLASSPALPMESSGISNGLSHDFSVRDTNMEDPLSDDSISMPNDLSGYNGDQDEMPSPLAQLQCALEKTGMLGKKLNLPAYPGADGTRALDRNCFPTSQTEDHQGVPYEELMYKCHLCSYTGNSKSHFDSHMNSHFDHRCPFCDYTSRTEGRLKRHVKDFHSETPPDSWAGTRVPRNDGSGGELSMDDSVSSTGNNNMNKPRTYRCKQCGFVAYKKNEFWEHNKTHIKAEKLLTCPQCAFVTEYKHHLEYHIRNHFGSKPFKCGKCNYSCVNKSMLNSHMKSHSNIYQYRCANCSYATKYCHSLKLHLRKYDHKPASVLNVDGTPNPYPVIDVYGTRRGPRPKKRKYADDSDTPGIINTPVISSQASMNYPAVMPSNLPMLYPPQFFNGYHGNVFIRPPTNGEAFRDVTSHRNPRFGFSPNPQPLKCLLCEFTPDNQEMLHKHMLLHAAKENQDLIKLYGINSETILQMQEQQMAANNYLHHQHHNRYLQENGVYKIEMERKGIKMAKIQDTSEINNVPELNYSVASIKELEEHPRRNEDLNHVQKEDIKVFERNEPFLPIGNGKEREDNESNIPSRSVIVSHKSPTPPAAPKEQEITEQKVFETQNIQSTQSIQPSIMESSPLDLSNGKTNDFQSPSSNDDVEEIFSSPTEVTMLKDPTNEPLCLPAVDNRSSPSNSSQAQPRNRRKGKAFKLDRYRQFEDRNALQFNGSNTKSRPIPENMLTPNNGMLKSFEHCTLNTKSNSHSSMDNSLMEHRNSPKKFLSMPTSQVSSPSSFNDRMLSIPSPRQANILQQDTSTVSSKTTPMAMKPLHTVPAKSTSPLSKVPELVPKVEPDFTETKEKDQKWQDAYMCTFCDMAFRDGMMYSMHVGYHMNGDPYTCNMCGHASKDKVEFFLHIARVAHS